MFNMIHKTREERVKEIVDCVWSKYEEIEPEKKEGPEDEKNTVVELDKAS